jgi:imidazolonepropionase-like amidohydrolase
VVVDGVPEVRRAARAEIRRGANHIKIMGGGGAASPTDRLDSDQFSEEEIAAIVDEANMANLYTVVHAYTPRTIERAARLGVRSIEHANYLNEPTAQLLRERGCIMVPTLTAYHTSSRLGIQAGMSAFTVHKINALLEDGVKAVEIARRAGVPMAFGSDLIGTLMHNHQLDEFSLRREVVPAAELVRSATIEGARLARMDDTIGRVAPGYRADLLVVDGNPLEDITVLQDPARRLRLILRDGEVVKSELN